MIHDAHFIFALATPWVIITVLLVLVLLFGGKKLPELARGLGSSIKEFKKATRENDDEDEKKDSSTKEIEDNSSKKE